MSLEATLNTTNELLAKLIGILTTGMEAEAALGPAEVKPKRGRPAKAAVEPEATAQALAPTPALAPAPASSDGITHADMPWGLVDGDPIDTRYFLIAAHNTVLRQLPGDPMPSINGAVRVTAQDYLAKKAEFAAMTQSIIDGQKAGNAQPATTPAPATTPSAQPASSTGAAESQPQTAPAGDVSFKDVVDTLQALMRSPAEGHGRAGVLTILKQFLPDDAAPTVPKLEALGKNGEIKAAVEAMLKPAEFDLGI